MNVAEREIDQGFFGLKTVRDLRGRDGKREREVFRRFSKTDEQRIFGLLSI